MPTGFYAVVIFLFGITIGSFLNVVIYRLHTGKSLNNRSHCLSCGQTLSWYELFPLLSYVFLRGRCRHCGCFIPSRYFIVELLTGLAFLASFYLAENYFIFGLICALLATLIVGAVYDLYHLIIPDEVSYLTLFLAIVFTANEAYFSPLPPLGVITDALAGGALCFGVFASLWLISNGRWMGFADAKLSFGLGLCVGLSGAFSMLVLSFWLGAILSLAIILWQYLRHQLPLLGNRHSAVRVNMKSEIPFAPFIIIAFLLVFLASADVLSMTSYVVQQSFFNI